MENITIGVTGATGQLGQKVIAQLKNLISAEQIVALVRNPDKATGLNVVLKTFDYTNLTQIEEGLQGIDRLLLISSSEIGQRATQHKNVIDGAKTAGVKFIVYTSLLHADTTSLDLAPEHLATEAALKESGIPHTILRNGWYTENYTGSVPGWVNGGAVTGSADDGKISSASREDYALAAAKVITGEGHEGKVYELAGDDAYTLSELAAELSKQTGKNIPYNNISEAAYKTALESWGIPDWLAGAIAGWDVAVAKGELFDNSKTLSELIGRPTTSLAKSLSETLATIQ